MIGTCMLISSRGMSTFSLETKILWFVAMAVVEGGDVVVVVALGVDELGESVSASGCDATIASTASELAMLLLSA